MSVVGLGGVGKSALVLEFLGRQPTLPHTFCRLDHDAEAGFAMALRAALGPARDSSLPTARRELEARGEHWLVLDGAEVLHGNDVRTLVEWTDSTATLRVLATSRRPLRAPGEHVLHLEPLALPAAGAPADAARTAPAVALLLDSMERAGASTPSEIGEVVALAEALGGLPLGLLLCARTASLLGPARALDRLGDVVALPDPTRAPAHRQASLRHVLDATWNECPPWVRSGLAQASVFETAFTLDAAEAVLELEGRSALELVHELRDRALLQLEPMGDPRAERRFRLHELIRRHAIERRGPDSALRRRHEAHFLGEPIEEPAHAPFPDAATQRRLVAESPDLFAACASVRADEEASPERLARVGLAARALFLAGIRVPAMDALIERVTRPEVSQALGVAGASAIAELVGTLRTWEGDERADEWLERAERLADESGEAELRFGVLLRTAHQQLGGPDPAEATKTVVAMRALLPELGAGIWHPWVMALEALVERHRAEVPWLRARLSEAARAMTEGGAPDGSSAWVRARLADLLVDDGQHEAALAQALEVQRVASANPQLRAYGRMVEAFARLGSKDIDGASRSIEALEAEIGDDESIRRLAAVSRAALLLEQRRWGEAMVAYDALSRLPVESGDEQSAATVALGLAVAGVHAGAPERARAALAEAAQAVTDPDEPLGRVHRRVATFLRGEPLGPRPRLRPTRQPAVAAMLRRIVDATLAERPQLELGLDCAWVAVGGAPAVQLTRRPVLRRLLAALVREHEADPGGALSTDELFEEGWPGESIDVGAARNRTRVALARLRKLGLRTVLERVPEGVRLVPLVRIHRVDPDERPGR